MVDGGAVSRNTGVDDEGGKTLAVLELTGEG